MACPKYHPSPLASFKTRLEHSVYLKRKKEEKSNNVENVYNIYIDVYIYININ